MWGILRRTFRVGQYLTPAPLLSSPFLSPSPPQTKLGSYATFLGCAWQSKMGCLPCHRADTKDLKHHSQQNLLVRRRLVLYHSLQLLAAEEFIRGSWVFHLKKKQMTCIWVQDLPLRHTSAVPLLRKVDLSGPTCQRVTCDHRRNKWVILLSSWCTVADAY